MAASYLDKLYPGQRQSTGHKVFTDVLDFAEISGSSFAFGYLMQRYRDKATLHGIPYDLLVGGVMTAGAVVGEILGVAPAITPIAKNIGHAGLASYCHTQGSALGAKSAGVKRVLAKDSDIEKIKKIAPSTIVLGAIPKAAHGDFLSSAELANLAK